jgi:hypothetical protein
MIYSLNNSVDVPSITQQGICWKRKKPSVQKLKVSLKNNIFLLHLTTGLALLMRAIMSDCEMRWWSMLHMIGREIFEDEFRFRESANTPTTQESLRLSDDDFDSLKDLINLLSPFKRAQ